MASVGPLLTCAVHQLAIGITHFKMVRPSLLIGAGNSGFEVP